MMNRRMTREHFKSAYQFARKTGSWHFQPDDPVRIVLLARLWGTDPLEYRASCTRGLPGRYSPYGAALARYKIAKRYAQGSDRPAVRALHRPGFDELVGRELEIRAWLDWGRVETDLDELAGGIWVFGGEA